MRKCDWITLAGVFAMAGLAGAQDESVYAPPAPVSVNQGTNEGGINFNFDLTYLTDYVYRGVDYGKAFDPDTNSRNGGSSANVHSDVLLQFDLRERMPHPFLSNSANINDSDPGSRFQEFRTAAGADLRLQPVTFTLAVQTYTYPQREDFETSEVHGKMQFDDSRLLKSDTPVLKPYILGAYDYDLNDGWYIEVGISHDFVIEDLFLVIRPVARIAYTEGWQQQFVFNVDGGTGWQHVEYALQAEYKLNSLLNLSKRWGEWFLRGQVAYSEHLSGTTVGHTQTWGGVGIGFEY